ncbi:MAG: hypothetical protein KAU49_03115, partial [Candidatus Krumholzibacteria bacterium]|nr:hypothetical protein [Candidatus Krumholzibacteria bacterium]
MRKTTICALMAAGLLAAVRVSAGPGFTGECAVFFERGHYWVELGLSSAADTFESSELSRRDFVITDGATGQSFNPSRVEIVSGGESGRFVVLSSGKLKGKRCYRVLYGRGASAKEFGPVCDPAGKEPSPVDGGAAEFFRDHVAPAFSAYGEEYRFNRLSVGYDFTSSRGSTDIAVEPVFGRGRFSVIPFFTHDGTTYTSGSVERTTSRLRTGIDAVVRGWTGPVRLSFEGGYTYDRESPYYGSIRTASSARGAGTVRLDNLFDRINRHAVSVFKGIDVGAGYAWYDSTEAGGKLPDGGPLLIARITWTLAASLQLSYGMEACYPGSEEWQYWHRARVRLLLRNALAKPRGRSYHPDLELAVDWGR